MELEQVKSKFAQPGNESALLACVCKDPTNYYLVESKLSETDFLTPHHRAIWTVIRSLIREDLTALDTSAILNQSTALGLKEDQVGGYEYISALFDKRVEPGNLNFYIDRVLDASVKYKVLLAAQEIKDLTEENKTLTGETLDASSVIDHAQQKFLQISIETQRAVEAVDISEGMIDLLEEVGTASSSMRGLHTGFPRLDEALNGLEPGTLTVVGARPKVGKSALLLNWARTIAYNPENPTPVLYIDTEMSVREQRFRLLSMLSGVPERQIKNGTFKDDPQSLHAVDEAVRIASSGLILHKYYPDFTAEGVSSLLRKYYHQLGIRCLIFDYIKLPDADLQLIGNVKEHQALGYLCVALKNVAGQLNIPVITAAQIGRGGANKGHVTSADFADSDRILRYANTLLGLSFKTKEDMQKLEEQFGREQSRAMGTHRLQILDARAGGTNFSGLDIYFRKEILTMTEASVQSSDLMRSPEEESNEL